MNCLELLNKALEEMDMAAFLRGEFPYEIEQSQYESNSEPTDVSKVLSRAIYIKYKEDAKIRRIFEDTLLQMTNGTVLDIYIALLYIVSQLFKEKNCLSPFKLNFEVILPKLKSNLQVNKENFMQDIVFSNGFIKKNVWSEIQRLNSICYEEYGISLLNDEYK